MLSSRVLQVIALTDNPQRLASHLFCSCVVVIYIVSSKVNIGFALFIVLASKLESVYGA